MHRSQFNSRSVDGLYAEALVLLNEVRHGFAEGDDGGIVLARQREHAQQRIAGAVAWLREQKRYFNGEISLFRLRLVRLLPPGPAPARPDELAQLPDDARELVEAVAQFHARLHAIDRDWRHRERPFANALARIRQRLFG